MNAAGTDFIIQVESLSKSYDLRKGFGSRSSEFKALDNVDFNVAPGESVGIVGESGSGKSTLCRFLAGDEAPKSGRVLFNGQDVWKGRSSRGEFQRSVQMVFQSPRSSFDPRMRVGTSLAEPLRALRLDVDAGRRIPEVLEQVGIGAGVVERYPHEFSGGQLQRLAIARALISNPRVLVADEPVSALDVSIQAQVLNLLKDLVRDLGLALVVVAHDLSVVGYTASRVVVVSEGQIVEEGSPARLFTKPTHHATKRLVDAVLTVKGGLEGRGLEGISPADVSGT